MTPEQIEKEKQAFEEYYAKNHVPSIMVGRTFDQRNGYYVREEVQLMWLGWKAAKEQAAEQNRWIDIKTELPETFQTVIVFTSNGYIYSDWRIDDTEELEWEFTVDAEVLYWKPLPTPPEKE